MTQELINYFAENKITSPDTIVNELLNTSLEELCEWLRDLEQKTVNTHNIPQYSSYKDGTFEMLKYLRMSGDFGPSFPEIGEHFLESGHKSMAYIKYGENHAKLAQLLGLVEIKKTDKKRVYLSEIGRTIEKLSEEKQYDCFAKLAVRIPIVQEAIKQDIPSAKELEEHLKIYLSPVTALRRRKNTWELIKRLQGCEHNGI